MILQQPPQGKVLIPADFIRQMMRFLCDACAFCPGVFYCS